MPDTLSLTDLSVTSVDVNSGPAAKKARLEMPNVLSQPGTIARITPDTLTSRFQILCNSDDGVELAYLLSVTDEITRKNWFSSPLAFSEKGDTPMMHAARHGHAAVVETLIDYQANPCENNLFRPLQSNALTIAAQVNQAKVIQVMTKSEQFDPDKPRGDGITAMFLAIQRGHTETTKILLEHNADPNYKIRFAKNEEGFRDIGSFGENEPIPSSQIWMTPVMYAVSFGKPIILEQLLSNGGNPNNIDPVNPLQQSPLLLARSSPNFAAEMINLLLKCEADMHERMVPSDAAIRNITQEKTYLRPTLLEDACFSAATKDDDPQFCRNAEIFCNYYRTPEGKPVEPSILKWFYTGQCFLKAVALDSTCCNATRNNSLLNEYLVRNLSSLIALFSVFGQEESSESQNDKFDRAVNYAIEIEFKLHQYIHSVGTAMLQAMVVKVLEQFNEYNMDFNDEAVTKFLRHNEIVERTNPTLKEASLNQIVTFVFISFS
ncbi:ankyrin repeat domain-containing protein [Endozoicomonas sp. YOMI1]|uniref:ankyrin repeat domain-containing protein n=1 Tax=Endozoicomonas sp. YOMI1 TaxID=2828739 RepID=UPI0021474E02|nr:ankyrin repeat domain-containing protein [Endozoicomonas sp. YOMI1]